jgi:hypothetical protein
MVIALLLAAAAAQPSPEALRLGREIAAHGTLAALLPLKQQQDTADLLGEDKTLSAAEQAQVKQLMAAKYAQAQARLFDLIGRSYAERLSLADLQSVAAFFGTPAAARFQAALPGAIGATMQSLRAVDLKTDVRAAFCKQTGKLCTK